MVMRRRSGASVPSRAAFLQRQCACGTHTSGKGECAECARRNEQRSVTIGEVNDPLEREADWIAASVLSAAPHAAGAPARPRRSGRSGADGDATPRMGIEGEHPQSGSPLEPLLRQDMEHRFGRDFSGVRVHTDSQAARAAESVDANAYTVGREIVFGAGRYQPHESTGRFLLAHELAHVVQQEEGAADGAVQRQERRPRLAPVDADAQRIIDMAQDTTTPIDQRGPAVVQAIIDQYFPGDASKVTGIRYRADEPGLQVNYAGTGTSTTGTLDVGSYFVENTTQRHFARRVLQVGHELEHIGQVRSGMGGESRSDEREFIAHYHGALGQELPGTGRVQHSVRVQMIDGALGYYYCLSSDLQTANTSKRDELVARRGQEVRRSGHTDLGEAPRTCRRASGEGRQRGASAGGGLSGAAIAGIVIGGIAAAAAIGVGIAALAGAF
jgi:hypothetical protein